MAPGRDWAARRSTITTSHTRTSGPCCQSPRVAVDHMDVHRQNTSVESMASARSLNRTATIQKNPTPASAPKMAASKPSSSRGRA